MIVMQNLAAEWMSLGKGSQNFWETLVHAPWDGGMADPRNMPHPKNAVPLGKTIVRS